MRAWNSSMGESEAEGKRTRGMSRRVRVQDAQQPSLHFRPRLGIERCGKIHTSNSGAESWTGIGVVTGFGAVVLIRQGPHTRHVDARERIKLLQRLQEVRIFYNPRNQLQLS